MQIKTQMTCASYLLEKADYTKREWRRVETEHVKQQGYLLPSVVLLQGHPEVEQTDINVAQWDEQRSRWKTVWQFP